jgi:ssRNA-specific RNase YbeY (16S rRNA maturation enzyme)
MILEFIFPNERIEVQVNLLDNPGVAHWANKFLNCNYTTNVLCHDHLWVHDMDTAKFNHAVAEYQILIGQLAQHGIVYAGPNIATVDHHVLNHVHRFFTHNQQLCNTQEFGNSFDYSTVMTMLDLVNHHVHELECYIPRGPADMPVNQIEEIKLYHPTQYGTTAWLDLNEYDQYHSDQHYDIILSSEVLGKTLLQSYLDQDDPTDWDTSGHYASAGGLQITYQPIRQQIYQSASFAQWLDQHNADPAELKYDFPIGNIQDRDTGPFQQVLEQLRHCRFGDVSVNYRKNS